VSDNESPEVEATEASADATDTTDAPDAADATETTEVAGAEAAAAPKDARSERAKQAEKASRAANKKLAGTKKAATSKGSSGDERPRLKQRYDAEIRAQLRETLALDNIMEVPRLEKIVVNMGVGRATQQPSLVEGAVRDLEVITGQKPLVTRARKSIAGFKLREGQPIGVKVTMRGDRAWEFLDRLIALAIPRIRDFRGLSPRSFDGHGNYTFGVTEQLIFPEVDYDKVDVTRGMDITICTTARTDDEGRAFLVAFGFPFRQEAA
jgi:large subunit ribosomal protein L5